MKEIKKILVPIDFSINSKKLVSYAAQFSKKLNASLCFLNVIEFVPSYEGFASAQFTSDLKYSMDKKMASLVDEFQEQYGSCESEVLTGDVVDMIIERSEACELIIIATHGYRGLEKILMGSVADRVVHKAPCPVLLLNPYLAY